MKKIIFPLLAFIILTSSAVMMTPTAQSYKIGDGFSIAFNSKDPSGIFTKLKGDVAFDENDLANSHFNFTIDISSISMGNGMKNKKSQTEEWFDAAHYPNITFTTIKIEKTDKGYFVDGNMSIKGVKRYRKIPFEIVTDKNGMKITGSFYVERLYYKIGEPSDVVPDKFKITYSIPLIK